MLLTKRSTKSFELPQDLLNECKTGPVEISDDEQPYVIMTTEYLRRLLADASLGNHLDNILKKLKKSDGAPEEKVMSILEHK
ncbi:hypothetical protein H8E88_35155 [candidate division KSB1 bacterium]|nr:hypothetical protein [candidate division KSB1 bacterium]